MTKMLLSKGQRVVNALSRGLWSVGASSLLAMMLLGTADVLLRYLFNRPIKGTLDLSVWLLCFTIFCGFAYTAASGRDVRIDIVSSRLSQRAQAILDSITCFITLGLVAVIVWQSALLAVRWWHAGEVTLDLALPAYPPVAVLSFAAFVLWLVLLVELFHNVSRAIKK